MRKDKERIQTDTQRYSVLERSYETVAAEVRQLEGQLADYNLALDKMRTHSDINDIRDACERLRENNDEERRRIDEVFMKRAAGDSVTAEIQNEIDEIHRETSDRLADEDPSLREEFNSLREELQTLNGLAQEKEGYLHSLDERISRVREDMRSGTYRTHLHGMELLKKRQHLQQKKAELEEETAVTLSPEEMRERLLTRVKVFNGEIKEAEAKLKNLEADVDRNHDLVREKQTDITNAKKHASKASKYEALYERDRKLQEFIDKFPEAKKKEEEKKAVIQKTIVSLLQHISKGIGRQGEIPDASRLQEMQDELAFKQQQKSASETTLEMLKSDLAVRKKDLDKINQLDTKIDRELEALKEKMVKMEQDLAAFDDPEKLREMAEQRKKELIQERAATKQKRDAIKHTVQLLSIEFEKQKKLVNSNDTYTKLSTLESKLRQYSQTVFTLSDFILTRQRESDYEGLLSNCLNLTTDINRLIIQSME